MQSDITLVSHPFESIHDWENANECAWWHGRSRLQEFQRLPRAVVHRVRGARRDTHRAIRFARGRSEGSFPCCVIDLRSSSIEGHLHAAAEPVGVDDAVRLLSRHGLLHRPALGESLPQQEEGQPAPAQLQQREAQGERQARQPDRDRGGRGLEGEATRRARCSTSTTTSSTCPSRRNRRCATSPTNTPTTARRRSGRAHLARRRR